MKLVVTGASGFLGRALLQRLVGTGIEAVGVSRQSVPGMLHVDNYSATPAGDVLVHLAEASDRKWVESNRDFYVPAASLTLNSLVAKGFKKIIYASSAVLYGDVGDERKTEADPLQVVDAYTVLKFESEQAVLSNNGVVARLSNLYGPGMSAANVMSKIIGQIRTEGPVHVFDDSPVRDFLWIEDAADALLTFALSDANGIFNVGSGQGVSIHDLAKTILNLAGQKERLILSGPHAPRPSRLVLDITRTMRQFDWSPHTQLADGLEVLVKSI
jgi:UDP-glucose 4-epimerase